MLLSLLIIHLKKKCFCFISLSPFKCTIIHVFNSVLASGDFGRLLITFANNLDPDQDRQNVGFDLDPNCLTH